MHSTQGALTSPTDSAASCGTGPLGSGRPAVAKKSRGVYHHEPYSTGVLILPSQLDSIAQRAVSSVSLHSRQQQPLPTSHPDNVHNVSTAAFDTVSLMVTPRRCHSRYTALSSTSTDTLETLISPSQRAAGVHGNCPTTNRSNSHSPPANGTDKLLSVGPLHSYPPHKGYPHCEAVRSCENQPPLRYRARAPSQLTSLRDAADTAVGVPAAGWTVVVALKYGKAEYRSAFPVAVNELVVVEGDRGIDMGIVERFVWSPSSADLGLPSVLRRPFLEDLDRHYQRFAHEAEAVRRLKELCASQVQRSGLCPDAIRDVMFQLDGKKITIIVYRASNKGFFDFRVFQRQVFELYHCRVWFSYLDEIQKTMSTHNTKSYRALHGSLGPKGWGKGARQLPLTLAGGSSVQ